MTDQHLVRRDAACVWHPYTRHGAEAPPLPVVGARDEFLRLADGRELIDAVSSWWCCLHGHGPPALVDAMAAQARALDHVLFAGATHAAAVSLAERLLAIAPTGLTRAFYSDDGSTAVEVALKVVLARWVLRGQPQRRVMVALEGGYHGDTFGAMSVGDPDPFFLPYRPLLFEVARVPPEADALATALDALGDRAAGVIVEPLLQAARGMRLHPPAFLRAARAACDARGLPLVADEVMTGFGRTGTMFACAQAGIAPDLMCVAKGLTNGMLPLAATLATEEMFAAFLSDGDRRRFLPHGHTMTANPIACALALASLDMAVRDDVPARLAAVGARIHARVAAGLGAAEARARDLRVLGGMVALDLAVPPGDQAGYSSGLAPRVHAAAVARGVLLRPLGNVLYALPPACTSPASCDRIADAMVAIAGGAA